MAARFPVDPPSQQELMAIAREIPAHKIGILAPSYLAIDETQLSHIEHDTHYNSVQTNFQCLLHWCRNTEEPNPRQALHDLLSKAVKEGLVTQKGVDVLKKQGSSTDDIDSKNMFLLKYIQNNSLIFYLNQNN